MISSPTRPRIFISYNRADLSWAEWIAWTLEEAGYSVVIQAWDFRPGSNFVLEMQKAATTTDRILVVLSENYLRGEFTQPEWAAVFAQDPQGYHRKLVPVRIQECSPAGLLAQVVWIDLLGLSQEAAREALLQGLEERGKPDSAPNFPGGAAANRVTHDAVPFPGSIALNFGRLPTTGPHFVGREVECARLDAAWEDLSINVLSVVAMGGVGKSALVAQWLDRLAAGGWCGAERVLDWSFYSQGTEDRVTTAEPFLDYALRAFGDPDPRVGSPHDRGVRLACLVREKRTLLVLDGVEPLQHPPGPLAGRLKDPGLAALLKGLAAANPGLCVITTREPLVDVAAHTRTAQRIDLEALHPEAGIELLRKLGVEGKESELRATVEDFAGHALSLTLLGNYLRRAHGGDVRKRKEIAFGKVDEKHGGPAFRVISAYARWLGEGPELAILRLLGLFEGPARAAVFATLRTAPAISGLTEPLSGLDEEDWRWALSSLREYGLLNTADPQKLDPIDAHPLVRAYFREELEVRRPEAWREGNFRLFEFLKKFSPEYPDTLEAMQPLYAAVIHGCRAGRHQQAMSEVFWPRIRREHQAFSLHILGAFGSELTALAAFFDHIWDQPSTRLLEADRTWLLNDAGYCLRALGRLEEALQPMQAGLETEVHNQDWEEAAVRLNNLSSLSLALGNITDAVEFGKRGIEIADLGNVSLYRRGNRAVLADALHQAGLWGASSAMFREAEVLQAEEDPTHPRLIALKGYRYCDFLLSRVEPEDGSGLEGILTDFKTSVRFRQTCQEVRERAAESLPLSQEDRWLLDIGLDHLILGRACLGLALSDSSRAVSKNPQETDLYQATVHLDHAVRFLQQSGREDYYPRALLARAALRRFLSDHVGSSADLTEALEIADRDGMRLHECDTHLEWARLCRDQEDFAAARQHVTRARKLVNQIGYIRREREVAYLERTLGT